jgi:hypothetical protein
VQRVISTFLYLLRFLLCPRIWPILQKVPLATDKSVYCVVGGWNTL